jgi:hypothetical protein
MGVNADMIISHRHRLISIKSGKTASSSVEKALAAVCGPGDVVALSEANKHEYRNAALSLWQSVRLWLPPRIPVRKHQRWRRSLYDHIPACRLRRVISPDVWSTYIKVTVVRNPFDRAVSNYFWNTRTPAADLPNDIDRYVLSMPSHMISNWHMFADGNHLLLDTVLRYENLDSDYRALGDRLGIALPPLGREKGGMRPPGTHYREILSGDARRRIETFAGRELDQFSYSW